MPKYFIKTYGCQMNVNDSERLAGLLEYAGFEELKKLDITDKSSDAVKQLGIVLVNTCCVRAAAENKAFSFLSSLGALKKSNKKLLIGLCGCIVNEEHLDLRKDFPFIDMFIGPGEIAKLAEFLGVKTALSSAKRGKGPTAYITIMEGCDNFCTYCIVPYVRGRERSRSMSEILDEVEGLDKSVFREVVLLGQNVNNYKYGLAKLLGEVHRIEGIERIRFLTSHPRDMNEEIINAVKGLDKVCEYFHLPLQSGDDGILKAMNRGYTSDQYRRLVHKIRSEIPGAAVTSDAISGFPGETDRQFDNTCRLISELELDLVNTFSYSIRPGTAAAKLGGQLPEKIKRERLQELMKVVERTALKRNKLLVGSTLEILVDKPGIGRTRGNKVVKLKAGRGSTGEISDVRIRKAGSWVLEGELSN